VGEHQGGIPRAGETRLLHTRQRKKTGKGFLTKSLPGGRFKVVPKTRESARITPGEPADEGRPARTPHPRSPGSPATVRERLEGLPR
jgi:hypothetical protein